MTAARQVTAVRHPAETRWYAISEWVGRVMMVNALWLAGTLLGGVVLGAAPATAAAHVVARRYVRALDGHTVRAFVAAYRADFWRANAVLGLPALALTAALGGALALRGSALPGAGVASVLLLAAAVALGLALLYLPTLTAHYEIPATRAASRAFLFAVAHLPSTVVLLLTLAAVGYAALRVPGLGLAAGAGGWICLSTALCLAFFAQNDAALECRAAAEQAREGGTDASRRTATTERPQGLR